MECNGRSSGELEHGQAPAIAKPGKGRNPGGSRKTSRGGHDTQNQPFLRATRAKLPASPGVRGGCELVCQFGVGESWRRYVRQVSRGHHGRLVLPRLKETHTQAHLAQAGSAPRSPSNPLARTNIMSVKSTIPLRGTPLLLLLTRHCHSKQW